MTYSAGSTIVASDYNDFANRLNQVIGLGNENGGAGGTNGYGQTNTLTPVSVTNTITANQWSNLFTRLRSTLNHQGSTTTITAGNPATGDVIAIKTGLNTDVTTATNNRTNVAAGSLASAVTISPINNTTRTASWSDAITHTFTITFAASGTAPVGASAQDATRFFFNTGGYLQFSLVGSNNSGSPQDNAWNSLLAACGTIRFAASGTVKVGGDGLAPSAIGTNVGYYQLTTTDQVIFQQFDTANNYTANYVRISARTNTVSDPNSRGGRGNALTFTIRCDDAHTNVFSDIVTLDVATNCSYVGHNTTFLNNTGWALSGANTATWA